MIRNWFRGLARRLALLSLAPLLSWGSFAGTPAIASDHALLVPQAIVAPHIQPTKANGGAACTAPDGTTFAFFHCYTPAQIASAYGLDTVHASQLMGEGQTIVLVDAYGSPTAAADLKHFHDAFFPTLPSPHFDQIFPFGAPNFDNTAVGNGIAGPNLAAGWAFESTLDIEWAYATAPMAHIVLLATPVAESLGVQGFPNLFNAMQLAVNTFPRGTVFSQSFASTEQDFEGAGAVQTALFDQVYQSGIAKGDTFISASGDFGSLGVAKQARESTVLSVPTTWWPCTSPLVTCAGGTQLQFGWTWAPTSTVPFLADGSLNPAYFASTASGASEAVWNESWLPAATGGGSSVIYTAPSWQRAQTSVIGKNARGVPDLSWNAAVNGGVLVWISAFPNANGMGWFPVGGTSAASPQVAGLVALANEARAKAGRGPVGWLNPRLYAIGDAASSTPEFSSATSSNLFRDIVPQTYGVITLHDNQLAGFTVAGVPTLAGWDMTTGFGTPRAPQLIGALSASSP